MILVDLGSSNPTLSPSILRDFCQELRVATEIMTMVAIDDFNLWDQVTPFMHHQKKRRLESRELALVDAFTSFLTQPPKIGGVIFSLTSRATLRKSQAHLNLAQTSVESRDYSPQEFANALDHYKASNVFMTDMDEHFVGRFRGVTGSIPQEVFDAAMMY